MRVPILEHSPKGLLATPIGFAYLTLHPIAVDGMVELAFRNGYEYLHGDAVGPIGYASYEGCAGR